MTDDIEAQAQVDAAAKRWGLSLDLASIGEQFRRLDARAEENERYLRDAWRGTLRVFARLKLRESAYWKSYQRRGRHGRHVRRSR